MDRIMQLALVIIVAFTLTAVDSANILGLFQTPFVSHWIMPSVLLEELASRGHNVTVVSPFPLKSPPPNYHDLSLERVAQMFELPVQVLKGHTLSSFLPIILSNTVEDCKKLFKHPDFRDHVKTLMRGNYDVILVEAFGADCMAPVSQVLGSPVVAMTTSILLPWINQRYGNPDNPSYIPNYFGAFLPSMEFIDRFCNWLSVVMSNSMFNWVCHPSVDEIGNDIFDNQIKLKSTQDFVTNFSLLLVNKHVSMHWPQPSVPGIVEVAGLHVPSKAKDLPEDIKSFLDGAWEHGAIVLSFGSFVKADSHDHKIMHIFLDSIASIPQRVVWRVNGTSLVEAGFSLPKNLYTGTWIPQFDIMSHNNTQLFITHGGLGGTQEAMFNALPMIGIPIFADQRPNINKYANMGIAIHLEYDELTKDGLVDAINRILEPDSSFRKKAREVSRRFRDRPMTPLDTAVYWTEYVARHGGVGFLRPASVDIPWYQYILLDLISASMLACAATLALIHIIFQHIRKTRSKD